MILSEFIKQNISIDYLIEEQAKFDGNSIISNNNETFRRKSYINCSCGFRALDSSKMLTHINEKHSESIDRGKCFFFEMSREWQGEEKFNLPFCIHPRINNFIDPRDPKCKNCEKKGKVNFSNNYARDRRVKKKIKQAIEQFVTVEILIEKTGTHEKSTYIIVPYGDQKAKTIKSYKCNCGYITEDNFEMIVHLVEIHGEEIDES